MMVFVLSSFYAVGYFGQEAAARHFTPRLARRFGALWFGALWAMILVLVSNNLGIMWVGIEATTLLTAFLICIPVSPTSLEAMWKYLIMCSVGVAFAFIGTLLVAAAAAPAHLPPSDTLLWTRLRASAGLLDPRLLKAGFLFLLVGYGTKAGLAPMHNWLPDAHSQAPAPVSAIFSGFLLNAALYCILRYVPLAGGGDGAFRAGAGTSSRSSASSPSSWPARSSSSSTTPSGCSPTHSVEHMGIIALGRRARRAGHLRGALPHAQPLALQVARLLLRRAAGADVREQRHDAHGRRPPRVPALGRRVLRVACWR